MSRVQVMTRPVMLSVAFFLVDGKAVVLVSACLQLLAIVLSGLFEAKMHVAGFSSGVASASSAAGGGGLGAASLFALSTVLTSGSSFAPIEGFISSSYFLRSSPNFSMSW